jgi:hypothetical protein
MAGLKKRKLPTSPTLNSIKSDSITLADSDKASIKSGMKSPRSAKSSKSSWSSPVSAAKSSYESAPSVDQEALKRSLECTELLDLLEVHGEERARFLEFEQCLLTGLRAQREAAKQDKARGHQDVLDDQQGKVYSPELGVLSILTSTDRKGSGRARSAAARRGIKDAERT